MAQAPRQRSMQGARAAQEARQDAIHRALLTGLLGNVGTRAEQYEYAGPRGIRFHIFPGSGLFKARPPWVMAAELVQTTRLYARTVARVQPEWIERAAEHLVTRSYSDPHWNQQTGHVVAYEKVTLHGLTLIARRTVHYGPIDPKTSREIFIHHALVEGQYNRADAPFFRHNQRLIDEIRALEAKGRQRGLLAGEKAQFDFYDARVPAGIHNAPAFETWRRDAERLNPRLLFMSRRDLMLHGAEAVTQELYPDVLHVNGLNLPLEYHFEPGHPADGVTAVVPLAALNQLPAEPFEWLVPGMLLEKVTALIKSLPKALRVNFVPAPQFAEAAVKAMGSRELVGSASRTILPSMVRGADPTDLLEALASFLGKQRGIPVSPRDFDPQSLLDHLHMNFRVVDEGGRTVRTGRDLDEIRRELGIVAARTFAAIGEVRGRASEENPFQRDQVTQWDFGDLPESVQVRRGAMSLQGYPALVDTGGAVALRLLDSPAAAGEAHRGGVRRLFMLQAAGEIKYLERNLPGLEAMCLAYAPIGPCEELRSDLLNAAVDRALFGEGPAPAIRSQEQFATLAQSAWQGLSESANRVCDLVGRILTAHHSLGLLLAKPYPALLGEAVADMKQQLSSLVYKGFVTATPAGWLVHLPRYIAGISLRLQKLTNAGLARDEAAAGQVRPRWQRYLHHAGELARQGKSLAHPELAQYRWMMEELRVSLFAQELKAVIPISPKRLDMQWDRVVGGGK